MKVSSQPRSARAAFVSALLALLFLESTPGHRLSRQAWAQEIDAPTFNWLANNIFSAKCGIHYCHSSGTRTAGMNLEGAEAYDFLVGVPSREVPETLRVAPGEPEESYLVMKLEGRPGIVGARMPASGLYLSDKEISLIKAWIAAGAHRSGAHR